MNEGFFINRKSCKTSENTAKSSKSQWSLCQRDSVIVNLNTPHVFSSFQNAFCLSLCIERALLLAAALKVVTASKSRVQSEHNYWAGVQQVVLRGGITSKLKLKVSSVCGEKTTSRTNVGTGLVLARSTAPSIHFPSQQELNLQFKCISLLII